MLVDFFCQNKTIAKFAIIKIAKVNLLFEQDHHEIMYEYWKKFINTMNFTYSSKFQVCSTKSIDSKAKDSQEWKEGTGFLLCIWRWSLCTKTFRSSSPKICSSSISSSCSRLLFCDSLDDKDGAILEAVEEWNDLAMVFH